MTFLILKITGSTRTPFTVRYGDFQDNIKYRSYGDSLSFFASDGRLLFLFQKI